MKRSLARRLSFAAIVMLCRHCEQATTLNKVGGRVDSNLMTSRSAGEGREKGIVASRENDTDTENCEDEDDKYTGTGGSIGTVAISV